ncbi:SGNH/GDSL hydrolase family protein [Leuconostoc suionicum]|uniref:SGNH/GDSL hydrolase family protein n=1 Tax=Leuconostoc suionicum TaxID=1511761 RepID=UPI00300C1597
MKKGILLLGVAAGLIFGAAKADSVSADEIWTIGDSTSVGWDGNKNVKPWVQTSGELLGAYANGYHSKSGASIQSNFRSYVRDFENDQYKSRATWVVVNMGVNDVNYGSANINQVAEEFREGLTTLKAESNTSKIVVLLSQGDWQGGNNDTIHQGGYSMNQLRAAQRKVANDMNIQVIDPVVNDSNYSWKLGDKVVHPTESTYQEIGTKVASSVRVNNLQSVYTSYMIDRLQVTGYFNTLSGWRWLETGKAYTGFRYYTGTYYYFVNGVRQENQWVNMWGNKYYVGSDGRAYQGWHNISGVNYYFGDDGTYYLR